MSKVIYSIPGGMEQTTMKRYRGALKFFRAHGFRVVPVHISWKRHVMTDYVLEFFQQYNQHRPQDEVYLFGFSFGAMISFIASSRLAAQKKSSTLTRPTAQFLCSLSPFFKEDLPFIKKWWKNLLGIRRYNDFQSFSCTAIAQRIQCKTILFAGTREGPEVERTARRAHQHIKHSTLFMIDGARHDISQDVYAQAIRAAVSSEV